MSRRWFGTDGIRGVANVTLTPELAMRVARATTRVLTEAGAARILVGRDTRASGSLLQAAVGAGIAAEGGTAYLAGIIPTPGMSRLVAAGEYDGGIIISASHNPYRENGLKVIGPEGKKLSDAREARIEAVMAELEGAAAPRATATGAPDDPPIGDIVHVEESSAHYVDDLLGRLEVDLSGLRILLDCANGATYRVAPVAFRAAGAYVEVLCDRPDGRNINEGCGSTHLGLLSGRMEQGTFDLGLAFDGDGDRVLAVDASGREVNGDRIMTILASSLAKEAKLKENTLVVTGMSNLGLHRAMFEAGIEVEITDVGDRCLLERMEQTGAVLGGEQSGHIIYLEAGVTGDGMQTGLLLAEVLKHSGSSLADLADGMKEYPRVLLDVSVGDKSRLADSQAVWEAVRSEERDLGDEGRIFLRPSSTDSLVRVMVEARTRERCEDVANRLADTVKSALV
ncbi:MAG TPA: phosphoglucosamine mutase [Thermoleophilia bacterium]|nr:phosphoglucosamine mutase [Thermoleophilia bacterium]